MDKLLTKQIEEFESKEKVKEEIMKRKKLKLR
jgi:hypothetical protein